MGVKIKDIPISERPCERLIRDGVESLSNEELLAIVLKTGTHNFSSKELATVLLSKLESIQMLKNVNLQTLTKINGIGIKKACNVLAAIELGKRVNREIDNISGIKLNSSNVVYQYFKEKIGDKKQEFFYTVYLDNLKRVITDKLLFIGTINYSLIHPREVFKEAYMNGASAIICVHNHPSGNVIPSRQDYDITKNLVDIGNMMGIKILDHIIIGKNKYYSFLENNDMNF